MYGYKLHNGGWTLFIWPMNIGLVNSGSWSAGQNLFTVNSPDAPMQRIFGNPPFRRAYWRALGEIATVAMDSTRINPILDAKYAAFQANGINVQSPSVSVKTWIANARSSILSQLAAVNTASFTAGGPDT